MDLRYYQQEAIDATFAYWENGGGNPLIELATGTGKSLVIADLCKRLIAEFDGVRIIVLTHVRELVQQNAKEILGHWPQAPVGINSASLGRRDTRAKILFASIQSVHDMVQAIGPRHVVIIDEVHLLPVKDEGTYRSFLKKMKKQVPDMRVVGLTATPFRMDSGPIITEDSILTDCVYRYDVGQGVKDGYLSPLVSKATASKIDLTGVKITAGDYNAKALEAALDQDWLNTSITDEIASTMQATGRRSAIVFATGIDHSTHLSTMLNAKGVVSQCITSKTEKANRDRWIKQFKEGQIEALVSVGVLSTGFNAPNVNLLAMVRPTHSASLYIQQAGRGTRLFPGKENCLLLDFAENVRRHGPVDAPHVPRKKGDKEPRGKECPSCASMVSVFCAECPDCGHVFEAKEVGEERGPAQPKYKPTADAETPVMTSEPPRDVEVQSWILRKHFNPEKKNTLRVEYGCGFSAHKEWVCFDHDVGSYPQKQAEKWWRMMGGEFPPPASVDEAIERKGELNMPTSILVKSEGKYFKIMRHTHAQQMELI